MTKIFKKFLVILIVSILSLLFSSCSSASIKLTFDANGGLFDNGENIYVINYNGDNLKLPTNPKRDGYVFEGWFWMEDSIENEINANTKLEISTLVDITIFAKWSIESISVSITFDSKGGSIVQPITIEQNSLIIMPDDPVRDGYTFGGWYIDNSYEESANSLLSEIIISDIIAYAKWNVIPGTEGLVFELIEGEYSVVNFSGSSTNIIIPVEYNDKPVTRMSLSSISGSFIFKSVYIPASITHITPSPFEACLFLEEITVSEDNNAYKSIDGVLFNKSGTKLLHYPRLRNASSYVIPDGVTIIEREAFKFCGNISQAVPTSNLLNITFPNSLLTIENNAFEHCNLITDINLPDGLTTIKEFAFKNCTILGNIFVPNSVIILSNRAFDGTEWYNSQDDHLIYAGKVVYKYNGNSNIILNNDTIAIASMAFYGCEDLTNITITENLLHIGNSAFVNCNNLSSIYVSENNPNYSSIDGVLYDKDATELIFYPKGKTGSEFSIPDSVTAIGLGAFEGCNLSKINISYNVTYINDLAFRGCKELVEIFIPNSVIYLGSSTFASCDKLRNILFDNNMLIESINSGTFSGLNLDNFLIPSSVKYLNGNSFFRYMTTEISFGDDSMLDTISNSAFFITAITNITIPNSIKIIEHSAFMFNPNLISITILAETPPIVYKDSFANNNEEMIIYVPSNSVNAYKSADGWSNFADIIQAIPT